ncbi:unnamed protein product [Closterium sp. Naga37s-1]|nr:unnamed protein product [Closterium sp. Naga37s-1]
MVHGDPSYQYGRDGKGGLDIQRQTMRKHQHSIKHEASVDRQQLRDGKNAAQKSIVDFENGDFMAEMGTPDMPLKDSGTYYSEEALAAKDAAEAYPDLDIVDHVVRSLAELLGRSGNFHLRFKELQQVLCETNLELQGIHSVRWLSRGLAVQRLADNLPAAVILLYENDPKAYLLVTSLKFHFMLFFLADVLKELNALNLKFQRRQVDVTHVLQMVDNTRLTLRNRYLSDADDFGDGSNELSAFLSKHASSDKREVKVTGTDSTGAPTTHEYTLHEQKIKGQTSGPGLDDCITLATGS